MAGRRGRILAIVGVVLLLIGVFAAWYGASPAYVQETSPIPPDGGGYQYFAEYDFSVLAGGTVQGNFSVLNGTPVTVFVFNDADYSNYVNGENLTGMYTATAVNGTIDLAVPGWNTYHVVFQHPAAYNNTEQDVAVNLSSTGLDPSFFLGGVAAILIGLVLLVFGIRRMRAPQTAAPSGVLPSRATYGGPAAPTGPDTATGGGGMYRIPPPLPGTPGSSQPAVAGTPAAGGEMPMGTVVLTLENHSAVDESVTVSVNGVPVSSTSVPAGTTQQASLSARLASPFGSMVTVDVVTGGGRHAQQTVFVGAHGTAPVTLRIG
jgi:hypothetical protein